MNKTEPIKQDEKKTLPEVLEMLLESSGMDLATLCRQIKIGYSSIYQVINSINQSPRISTLLPIAKYFNITIDQLIGEAPLDKKHITKSIPAKQQDNTVWDNELYLDCVSVVSDVLNKQDGLITLSKFTQMVKEIYLYSTVKQLDHADKHFAEWYCKHHLD